MPRRHRMVDPVNRARGRGRHGRGVRSNVTGPHLAPLLTRAEAFDRVVADTANYLMVLWPEDLHGVVFLVADMPSDATVPSRLPRWRVDRLARTVTIFRIPVERVTRLPEKDDLDHTVLIETAVFRAVADFLGKDPWDLAPDRFPGL